MPASRPSGRCAVGLTPEPGPRHHPGADDHRREEPDNQWAIRKLTFRVATDKLGSRLVRWAAVEAVQRVPAHTRLGQVRDRIGARRGRNIGVVAAARELVGLVFYGLRDHHIRCLPTRTRARPSVRAGARAGVA